MPGTTVQAFTDIDRYQELIRGARNIDLLVTGSGKFQAELTKIDLHHLWTQRGQASVSKIMHTTLTPTRSPIFFLTHQEQAHTIHNGVELRPGEILFYGRGAEHYHRFPAGTNWSAMSLTPEQLAEAGEAVTQRDLRAPITTSKIRPPARLLERLLHLNDTAARLAATMPDVIAHPEVARAIEQELMRVMVKCLTAGVVADLPGFRDLRVPVMRRFERVLEENRGRPLYMVEICAAIGVCDRMLRLRCTEEARDESTPLSLVAADAYGSPRAGPGGSRHDDRDGSRDQPGVRRDWPVFRRLSQTVRRDTVNHAKADAGRLTVNDCRSTSPISARLLHLRQVLRGSSITVFA